MAANTTTSVIIKPGKASSLATMLRGHISVALGAMRTNDNEELELAIAGMRRTMTSFETELRLSIVEEED